MNKLPTVGYVKGRKIVGKPVKEAIMEYHHEGKNTHSIKYKLLEEFNFRTDCRTIRHFIRKQKKISMVKTGKYKKNPAAKPPWSVS